MAEHDELREVQQAGAKVLEDSKAAFERGEMSDAIALVFRLTTVALMMKPAHQPGAVKIARECAEMMGFDFDVLEEQVQARIYEQVQFARITAGEEPNNE